MTSTKANTSGKSVVNRRTMMNMMLGTAIAGAAISDPITTAAAPLNVDRRALDSPEIDVELRQAFEDLVSADAEIAKLHRTYGDDADSREDYRAAENNRNNSIETLITIPASSMVGIQAKASALRLRVMFEDFESHQEIAVSLADDLACFGPRSIAQIPDLGTPPPKTVI